MHSVKLRKVGSSNVLTVPSNIKPRETEFDVFYGRNGAIVYTPKTINPFTDEKFIQTHKGNLHEGLIKTELSKDEF